MKKKLKVCLFAILVAFSTDCYSQIDWKPSYELSIGSGFNNYLSYGNGMIPIYNIGFYRNGRLHDRLTTRSYILLGNRGVNYNFSGGIFDYSCIQFQAGYQLSLLMSNKIKFSLGPYAGYNFKKSLDYSINSNVISEYGIIGLSNYETEDEFLDFELGLSLGVNLAISNRISIAFNSYQAITKVYDSNNPYKILRIKDHNYAGLLLTESEKINLDRKLNNALNTTFDLSVHFKILRMNQ